LKCSSPAIPNAIAAILLYLRDKSDSIPHAYFGWTEGNPIGYIFKYIFFGGRNGTGDQRDSQRA